MIGITGATGILGKILCKKLEKENIKFSIFKGDIRNKKDIQDWLVNEKFESIIHLAALVATTEVKNNPLKAYEVNVGGTINLLSEIKESGQKPWFFYASSSHVYQSKDSPISEDDALNPISLYGSTKYMGEKICSEFAESQACDFNICCGRIFSFYHETQKPPFLYPNIKKRLSEEDLTKPFFLQGANSWRDFLNAEEVIEIIVKLMNKKASGVVNIASNAAIKIGDFVQNIAKHKLEIQSDGGKPDSLIANIDKLNSLIN